MEHEVIWSKTYHMSGMEVIEADTVEEAEEKMDKIIGDMTGSMQYDPDKNIIDVQ